MKVPCLLLSPAVHARFSAWCRADTESRGRTFVETGVPQPDGNIAVPLQAETAAAIDEQRFEGQTDDDLVLELIAHGGVAAGRQ